MGLCVPYVYTSNGGIDMRVNEQQCNGSHWRSIQKRAYNNDLHKGETNMKAYIILKFNLNFKSLKLSPAARQSASTGQIVNMFSNDTNQIQSS